MRLLVWTILFLLPLYVITKKIPRHEGEVLILLVFILCIF